MKTVLAFTFILFVSCSSQKGVLTKGQVIDIDEKNQIVYVSFPCVNQKRFTKPCFAVGVYSLPEFDSVYVGKNLILK